ncbi:MAG TPA: hypothetical protein VHV30_14135 [Polyangiaceae bacterium]|nr:hypothetical protein [Polyangiaceae bacterium]
MNVPRLGFVAPLALVPLLSACGNGDDYAAPPAHDAGTAVEAASPAESGAPAVEDAGEDAPTSLNGLPTANGFQGVWGTSDSDVWAVGDMGTIVHFDGTTWTLVPSGVTDNLTGIMGIGPDDVFVTGDQGNLLHWDGHTWSIASAVQDTALLGLWVFSSTNVWAVGVDFDTDPGSSAYVRVYQGTSSTDNDVNGAISLWKVWGASPTDVWLAGTSAAPLGGDSGADPAGVIYRGSSDFEPVAYEGESVHGIWGSGANDVWVAPSIGGLQHWTGAAFDTNAVQIAMSQGFHAVSGTLDVDGATKSAPVPAGDASVADAAGASDAGEDDGGPQPADAGADGAAPAADASLADAGPGASDVWAVGNDGLIAHFAHGAWTVTPSNTTETLFGIWAPSSTSAWAVGAGATIRHWNGAAWSPSPTAP